MMLRDAQNANRAVSGALFAGLAVSMIIINALVRGAAFTIRAGARAIIRKGKKLMQHIIPDGPADTARIATVYCDDIDAWDTLAHLIAFETVPGGGEYGIGNSGLADIAEVVSEMEPQAQAPADIPAGAPRSRVYFRNGRRAAAFREAMESLGAARLADNEPGAIYVPARLARAMAAHING